MIKLSPKAKTPKLIKRLPLRKYQSTGGSRHMGLVHTKIVLKNPRNARIKPVKVNALADSGALHLCIPEHLRLQLKLEVFSQVMTNKEKEFHGRRG